MMQNYTQNPAEPHARPAKKILFVILAVMWSLFLAGFTSTGVWITLSILGPVLAIGGFALSRDSFPHIGSGLSYLGVFVVGLLLVLASMATLAPGLPASWLTATSFGWGQLENRANRLEQALKAKDEDLVGRLAARGLGSADPVDKFGRPLLFDAEDAGLVKALLNAGLSPDAADNEGRTLLMLTHDEAVAATLIDAGADPDARDIKGSTALTYASRKGQRHVELLLAAGADVHTSDNDGITVTDYFQAKGPLRELLEKHAGDSSLPMPRPFEAIDRGRTDWLISGRGQHAAAAPSSVTIRPEKLLIGDLASLDIRLGNNTPQDRLLQVSAILNNAAFFVGASHDARVENPRDVGLARTIRWPLLSLPAQSEGRLSLDIVARNDEEAGDLSVDVRYRTVGETEDTVLSVTKTPGPGDLVPVQLSWTSIAGPLAFIIIVYLAYLALVRAKRKNVRAVVAVVTAISAVMTALVVAVLVAGLAEPWFAFKETSCEVLDRRARLETMRTEGAYNVGDTFGRMRRHYRTYAQPMVAVRFMAQGQELVTTGFSTGMATHSMHELRQIPLDANVPCWFDPDQPSRFTVVRAPNAFGIIGLVLTLITTLVLAFVSISLRKAPKE